MSRNTKFLSGELSHFFRDYIQLNTSLKSGENYPKAISLIENVIAGCGFKTEVLKIPEKIAKGKNRINLIARRRVSGNLPTVLIYNHADVVPGDYEHAFEFSLKSGRAYGRGTADMKGSTVSILAALDELKEKDLRFNLVFIATTDEETDQLDQLRYITSKLKLPKDTLIFDPDTFMGGVSMAHLGVCQLEVMVLGKSAHSGMSNLGKNAVEDAGKLIGFFAGVKKEYESMRSKYPTFKSIGVKYVCSRCNVNMINGGVASNVVPDKCKFSVDMRFIPEADVKREKEKILLRLKGFCRQEKIDFEIVKILMIEGYASEHEYIDELDGMCKKALGESGKYCVMGSTAVSQWAKELKLPHFGIGVIRADSNIHGKNEFARIKDMEDLKKIIMRFLT